MVNNDCHDDYDIDGSDGDDDDDYNDDNDNNGDDDENGSDDSDLVSDGPRVGPEPATNSDHHNWAPYHLISSFTENFFSLNI